MIENWINKINELSEKAQEKEQIRKIERKNIFKRNLNIIFKPYDILFKYAGSFVFLVVPYIMLCSFVEFLAKYTESSIFAIIAYFMFFMILIAIGSAMMQKWYNVVFLKEKT